MTTSDVHVPDLSPGRIEDFRFQQQVLVTETFAPTSRDAPQRTIIIVHGIGMGRESYVSLAALMRAHGTVITVDLPGFGDSPEPPRTPTMERLSDLVAAFIQHRQLTDVVLIGHSMGTQIVAETEARHHGTARQIVLVAPTVDAGARTLAYQFGRLLVDIGRERPITWFRSAREYLRAGPHLIRKATATVVHRPERAYKHLDVPTLVIRGSRDPLSTRAWCDHILRLLPDGSFAELPGRGHGTMIGDARPAADVISDFLR